MAQRSAMLARMETICAEVMDMPEIFLDNDEDDNDDEQASDEHGADAAEEEQDAEQQEEGSSSEKAGKSSDKEKGVSVEVNCEDKKQRKYAKWISRALRAAVSPIVSKLNLSLKVNLDLNVANKEASKANTSNTDTKPPPNSREKSSTARIKELESEKRDLEKLVWKITSGYKNMKDELAKKSASLDKLSEKQDADASRTSRVENENINLKSTVQQLNAEKAKIQAELSQLTSDLKTARENNATVSKQFEEMLTNLGKQHEGELNNRQNGFAKMLAEVQHALEAKEFEVKKISEELKSLQELHTSDKTHFSQSLDENKRQQTQLELKLLNLVEKNREMARSANSDKAATENITIQNPFSAGTDYVCPLCQSTFRNLGDLQIHSEYCMT